MLFLILFVLIVLTLCWFAVWSRLDESSATSSPRHPPQDAGATARTEAARPASLEGVLTAQRVSGTITCGQYVKAMEGLAARDDERHPLAVPPEIGPADA